MARSSITLSAGQAAVLEGGLQLAKFAVGGPMMKGDTYAANSIVLTIPKTTIDMSPGLGGPEHYRIRTGDGADKGPIKLLINNALGDKTSQSSVTIGLDVTPGLFSNAAANKPPGGEGRVLINVDVDGPPLTESLPHLIGMLPNTHLQSGRFQQTTDVHISRDKIDLLETLSVKDVVGQNTVEHREIRLEPVYLTAKATDLGGNGALPDVRDILVQLATGTNGAGGYASANITGKTLSDVNANIHLALGDLRKEWSQLIDFGPLQLGGTLDVQAGSKGDLIGNGQPLKAGQTLTAATVIGVTGKDLEIKGWKDRPPLDEPNITLAATANLVREAEQFVAAIKDIHATLRTGKPENPTVDIDLTGNYASKPDTRPKAKAGQTLMAVDLNIARMFINPTLLQQEFGAFLPLADDQLTFRDGLIGVDGNLKYDGSNAQIALHFNTNKLTLDKATGATVEKVFDNYAMGGNIAATYSADGGNTKIVVSQLNIGDDPSSPQTMIGIENTGGKPIEITATPDGKMQGSGSLHIIRLSVARVMDLAKAFSPPPTAMPAGAPAAPESRLASGTLSGTTDFSTTDKQELGVDVNLVLSGVNYIVPGAKGLTNEDVKIVLTALATQNFASAALSKCDLTTSVLTAHIDKTLVQLKDGPGDDAKATALLDMVRAMTIVLDIPSLAAVQEKINAISPPTPAKPITGTGTALAKPIDGTASASADRLGGLYAIDKKLKLPANPLKPSKAVAPATETPPTELAGGSANITLQIVRNDKNQMMILPVAAIRDLIFSKGGIKDPVGPIDARGQLTLITAPPAATRPKLWPGTRPTTEPSLLDQIAAIDIRPLSIAGVGSGLTINGIVGDLLHARKLDNVTLDLAYNASMIWDVVLPLMSQEQQTKLKGSKVVGNYNKHFTVNGSYPADKEMNEAIANVNANGDIQLDLFDGEGVTLKSLTVPVTMTAGKARIAYAGKAEGQNFAPPAELNGGHLILNGIVADLSDPHMTVTIPPTTRLLDNISLNSVLAANIGDFINNPLLVGANEASGLLTCIVNQCDHLPTDTLLTETSPANQGVLDINMTVQTIQIGNATIKKISDSIASTAIFSHRTLNVSSLRGDVKSFHVHIARGITDQDMVLTLGQGDRPLHLFGTVAMKSREMNMTLDFPFVLFGASVPKEAQAVVGDGVKIVLTGPVTAPRFDLGKALQQNLKSGDLIKGLLNKGDKSTGSTTAPASGAKDNPVNDVLDLFKKKKKDGQ